MLDVINNSFLRDAKMKNIIEEKEGLWDQPLWG
jgi:hypothetical protein